jgi:hypothetical protein
MEEVKGKAVFLRVKPPETQVSFQIPLKNAFLKI